MRNSDVRRDIRLAGQVKRYSTWPVLNQQSTGEHSWQVLRIYIDIFGPPSPEVCVYIVHHDSAELTVGDPPFPLKRDNPDLKEIYDRLESTAVIEMRGEALPVLSREEMLRIKICDLIEMWEYGVQEHMMGNRFAEPIISDTMENFMDLARSLSEDEFMSVRKHVTRRMEIYA